MTRAVLRAALGAWLALSALFALDFLFNWGVLAQVEGMLLLLRRPARADGEPNHVYVMEEHQLAGRVLPPHPAAAAFLSLPHTHKHTHPPAHGVAAPSACQQPSHCVHPAMLSPVRRPGTRRLCKSKTKWA